MTLWSAFHLQSRFQGLGITWPMLMVTTKPTRDAEPNAPTLPRATLWMSVIVEPPAQTTTSGTAAMAGPAPPSTWSGSGYGF